MLKPVSVSGFHKDFEHIEKQLKKHTLKNEKKIKNDN